MNQTKISLTLPGLVYVLVITALALSHDRLPERVATHFNASREADGWMSRSGYL